jgi:hypothetical protein
MHGKLISKLRIIKTTTINHKIVLHCWPIIMVTSLPIFGTNERKRGGQKGKANIALTQAHWYGLCSRYELQRNNKPKLGQAEFLRSSLSGGAIQDTQGNRVIFGKKWRLYCKGELRSSSVLKRFKTSHFEDVEEKVVDYLELRARLYRQDKCGLSSDIIREKAMAIAANLGYAEGAFKASQGWISNVLRRHNKIGSNLHGEAGDMKESERIEIMSAWKTRTHQIIEDEGILPQCLYNADQTGLYYTKLPSKVYIDKEERGTTNGTKQMKSKDRLTLMVATAANGEKLPLAMIGKSAKPTCFKFCGGVPPMFYKNQKNAWFDRSITVWWLNTVFWPSHLKKHGNVKALLLLDNCSAHFVDRQLVMAPEDKLKIVFFPPNMTSNHQPADMGMIATIKVGYKASLLRTLLKIFDEEGGFEKAAQQRRRQPPGCRGLAYGGKPTVLDAMEILNKIWDKDGKYATMDGIMRC